MVAFIEKIPRDSRTHGWAYDQWVYDPATDTLRLPYFIQAVQNATAIEVRFFSAYPKRSTEGDRNGVVTLNL
jgi:hypothetical protein